MFVVTTALNRLIETPELKQLFDIGQESNVPTYVNTVLLTAVASFACLGAVTRPGRTERHGFWLVAAIAGFLAVEEAAGIHERVGAPADRTLDRWGIDWPTYAWVVPGAAVSIVVLAMSLRRLRLLSHPTRRTVTVAAAMFVGGAIGVESINGWVRDLPSRPGYFIGTMVEETLEMAACVVAGAGLLGSIVIDSDSDGRFSVAAT